MIDRREFLAILASAVAALGTREAAAGSSHPHLHPNIRPVAHLGSLRKAYTFLSPTEAEFIEAAIARLIPNDEHGPGALEADVSYFIDRLLTTEYGSGARFYNQGPFGVTTPYQGYQLPLTPPEVYRVGIAATNRYCEEKYAKRFAQLDPATQDEVLQGLQSLGFEEVPGATFFGQLLSDTKDGFFSDPVYGGNRDMIGWKLVGFPGVAANYRTRLVDGWDARAPAEGCGCPPAKCRTVRSAVLQEAGTARVTRQALGAGYDRAAGCALRSLAGDDLGARFRPVALDGLDTGRYSSSARRTV
jgi:gluconate 2-dehydrogenase gamma chain